MTLAATYVESCQQRMLKPNSKFLAELHEVDADGGATALTTIDLSKNFVGPAGFRAVVEVVRRAPALVVLNASDNRIDNDGLDALLVALLEAGHGKCSLEVLDLSRNPISLQGGKRLLQFARTVQGRCPLVINTDGTLLTPALSEKLHTTVEERGFADRQGTSAAAASANDVAVATQDADRAIAERQLFQKEQKEQQEKEAAAAATEAQKSAEIPATRDHVVGKSISGDEDMIGRDRAGAGGGIDFAAFGDDGIKPEDSSSAAAAPSHDHRSSIPGLGSTSRTLPTHRSSTTGGGGDDDDDDDVSENTPALDEQIQLKARDNASGGVSNAFVFVPLRNRGRDDTLEQWGRVRDDEALQLLKAASEVGDDYVEYVKMPHFPVLPREAIPTKDATTSTAAVAEVPPSEEPRTTSFFLPAQFGAEIVARVRSAEIEADGGDVEDDGLMFGGGKKKKMATKKVAKKAPAKNRWDSGGFRTAELDAELEFEQQFQQQQQQQQQHIVDDEEMNALMEIEAQMEIPRHHRQLQRLDDPPIVLEDSARRPLRMMMRRLS